MKYLITGISGFVGRHLVEQLSAQGHEVIGLDMNKLSEENKKVFQGVPFHQMNLMGHDELLAVVAVTRPERIVHLASASSVALSWEKPIESFVNNTNIFLNLIDAVRTIGLKCRILSVGSSEEYGPVLPAEMPLKESRPANPMSPYAVARVAQEHLSQVFARGYGLDIICTRSFNHVGPGQSDRFVISSFVRQALEVARGKRPKITCGSLDIVRDFIDVRDVIQAYFCLLDKGAAGEIYNVCSGKGRSLREVLERICHKVGIPMAIDASSALIRPIDNPVIIGDNQKISQLGVTMSFDLDRSLDDMIAWWSEKIS